MEQPPNYNSGNPNWRQQPNWNNPNPFSGQIDVPNATVTLVLGICSIVLGCLGPILGTIGLVMGNSGKKAYEANPGIYREGSYRSLNAGRICSIIGICLGALVWLYWIFWMVLMGTIFGSMSHF